MPVRLDPCHRGSVGEADGAINRERVRADYGRHLQSLLFQINRTLDCMKLALSRSK
jgi:hypothetical protein